MAKKPGRPKKPKQFDAGPNGKIHPCGFTYMDETPSWKVAPMSAIIPELYAKYGLGRRLALKRFLDAWQEYCDSRLRGKFPQQELARIHFINLNRGTLRFEVESVALFQELNFYRRSVLDFFQQKFPAERILQIRITVEATGEH